MLTSLLISGCSGKPTIVVVGGGPSGIAAAIEASQGAEVILFEAREGLGGLMGFGAGITALVSPELLGEWDQDAGSSNAFRTRYARDARVEVVDWLAGLGLRWLPAPRVGEEGIELLTVVGGGRPMAEVMIRELVDAGVEVRTSSRVTRLELERGLFDRWPAAYRVYVEGGSSQRADAVILATGGYMGNLGLVIEKLGLGEEAGLLRGAPRWVDGNGLVLALEQGASMTTPARVELYGHGVPDTESPGRALMLLDCADVFPIDPEGVYLPDVQFPRGDTGHQLLARGGRAFAIADQEVSARLLLSNMETGQVHRLADLPPETYLKGDLSELSRELGISRAALEAGLVPPGGRPDEAHPLSSSLVYSAIPLMPTTAKGLTGLQSDEDGRLLDVEGQPLPSLYAAGEIMGFGNLYEGRIVDNTMVAGAILTGRSAARAAMKDLGLRVAAESLENTSKERR